MGWMRAPAEPGERKVDNQSAGWRRLVLYMLCLLQAADALKGPRLVSGEPGGAVTIRCHYTPSSVNRHQRKYWCHLSPLTGLCHTLVSTNRYTHLRYRGRVALADFPQGGVFVVRLSPLSPGDAGSYRCGIGNRNNALFLSVSLTVSAGPSRPVPSVTPAAGELVRWSSGTASPLATRQSPGMTQAPEGQGTGWDRDAPTPGTSVRATEGKQSPAAAGVGAADRGSQVAPSAWTAVPVPERPALTVRGASRTAEGVWVWGAGSSVTHWARASEEGRETTTAEAGGPRGESEWAGGAPDADWTLPGTSRPPSPVSEKRLWETPRDARLVSKPPAPGSREGAAPAAGEWASGTTGIEVTTGEGSAGRDLDTPDGDGDHQATPNQDWVAGPLRPLGKGSSMKSASPGEGCVSRVLMPVSTGLLPLAALVLLRRRLRKKGAPELSPRPEQRARAERKTLWDDRATIHATVTVPERDPGP